MSRSPVAGDADDGFDPDPYAAYDRYDLDAAPVRRGRRHRRPDGDDDAAGRRPAPIAWDVTDDDPLVPDGARRTDYLDASHGPEPVPPWVVTTAAAFDYERGVVKTGKEADVDLVERVDPDSGASCLLAVKRYRSGQHRLFHRDAGYLEGRRTRRSRETRAMATRTAFGRELIAGQWAFTEFAVLARLWSAGVAVPYPVQCTGTELGLEFIGEPDGTAAPRLAEVRPAGAELDDLWQQCWSVLTALAATGFTHGDLSAYNVLVHHGRLVLIDLPQAVDIAENPQGLAYLQRDCENICRWFRTRGHRHADAGALTAHLRAEANL